MKKFDKNPTVRDVLYIIFKHKFTLVLFTFCSLFAATVYSYTYLPKYEATSKILINIEKTETSPKTGIIKPSGTITTMKPSDIIKSEIELLQGRDIAEKVLDEMGQDSLFPERELPKTLWENLKKTLKYTIVKIYAFLDSIFVKIGLKKELSPRERMILVLEKGLKATPIKDSNSVKVSFVTSASPTLAARVVNKAVSLYIDDRIRILRTPNALDFFQDQTNVFKQKLVDSEQRLSEFQKRWNLTSLEDQRNDLLEINTDLRKQISFTDIEITTLSAKISDIKSELDENALPQNYNSITKVNNVMDSLIVKMVELKLKKAELSLQHAYNPIISSINDEIKEVNEALKAEEIKSAVSADLNSLRSRLERLYVLLGKSQEELQRINELEYKLRELKREVRQNEDLYESYFKKTEEMRIADAMDIAKISNVKVTSIAYPPILPVRTIGFIPQRIFCIGLGLILGIFVSISLVALHEAFDHSFKSSESVEEYLDLPVLGTISENKWLREMTW